MAHFAKLNENNIVEQVIVVADSDCLDADNNESESVGVAFCVALLGGTWKQTSYNNNIRKQFASINSTYDASADEFVTLQPFASWTLDGNNDWQPTTAMPASDIEHNWDEDTKSWVAP